MTSASALLDCLSSLGANVRSEGNSRLIVRAGDQQIPGQLLRQIKGAKAEIIAELASRYLAGLDHDRSQATWWRRSFILRTTDREMSGYRSRRKAELLAYGDLILMWHRRHGVRPNPLRCAGCDDDLPDDAGIVVDGGDVRVHFDGVRHDDCIIAFGQKWRGAAVEALKGLGVDPPEGFEL